MKALYLAALTAVLTLGSVLAYADSMPTGDPHIKTGGAGGGAGPVLSAGPVPAGIITPDFTIFSSSGASPATSPCVLTQGSLTTSTPQCLFENDISRNGLPFTILKLVFDIAHVSPGSVTCGFLAGSPFSMCNVAAFGDGGTSVTFLDGSIPFHTDFTLELGSVADPWPKNTSFGVTATPTPEPGTLTLFFCGVGALLLGRRLRSQ